MSHHEVSDRLPVGRRTGARSTALVCACAASAGIHAGLIPEHLREAPQLGASFILAVALLLTAGAALAIRPDSRLAAQAAGLLLAGLILCWGASCITGIPWLQPRAEPVDAVGLVTKLTEALGLGFAFSLSQPAAGRRSLALQEVSR